MDPLSDNASDCSDEGLRIRVQRQLEQSGISSAVRKMVRQICSAKDHNIEDINPDQVIDEVYRRGLIAGLMDEMDLDMTKKLGQRDYKLGKLETELYGKGNAEYDELKSEELSDEDVIDRTLRKSGKYYLKVEVKGGRSFLDHILENGNANNEHPSCNEWLSRHGMPTAPRAKLKLQIFYKSQRFTSKAVLSCHDPVFKEVFLIEIERFDFDDGSVASKLLCINEPLRIMIVREDVNSQQTLGGSLIAYCLYDWRSILITESGMKTVSLELMGIGPQHDVCVGILQLRCTLVPTPHERVKDNTYFDKVNDEKATKENFDRSFVAEAKRWWKEYVEIRSEHQHRLIRIFAYDENMTARPVMTFIKPIIVDEHLLNPFQAAWFVSLLPTIESDESVHVGGENAATHWILPGIQNGIGGCLLSERFQNLDTTIVCKSGTVEDHAILLTSLLLTFGLDAYVAFGTKKGKGSWAWTISLSENQEPTCWESTTGEYYDHYSYPGTDSYDELPSEVLKKLGKNKMYNFLTVSCVFNNKGLYANIQSTTSMDFLDWNLDNPSKWKHLPLMDFFEQSVSSNPTRLVGTSLNWDFICRKLEFSLRNFIYCTRKENGIGTRWDDHFEQFMGQHLSREEIEVSSGGKDFKDFFQTITLKNLPPGYDFRARSIHSTATEAHVLFERAMREPMMQGIILARGDDIQHSMKVKIFPYPEDVPSVRVIIACKYIPVG